MNEQVRKRIQTILIAAIAAFSVTTTVPASSARQDEISWQGHTWKITSGGMAGVAPGDPRNVSIDSNGYLHLAIEKRDGKWTAAELFTVENLGFGTYQWVVEGDMWNMDPHTVLGLFPYGPTHGIGKDATNEIDIEFSQWNKTCVCNADFTVYPPVHREHGAPSYELNFKVDGGTNLTTARMVWSSTNIVFTLMSGNQPIGTTANVSKTETFTSSKDNVPQLPIPVGINFWAFKSVPAANQSIVIRSFQYVPGMDPGIKSRPPKLPD